MQIEKLDRESVTSATVVFRDAAIAGKPGRDMSMEKGPMAESNPRIRMMKKEFRLGWVILMAKLGHRELFLGYGIIDPYHRRRNQRLNASQAAYSRRAILSPPPAPGP